MHKISTQTILIIIIIFNALESAKCDNHVTHNNSLLLSEAEAENQTHIVRAMQKLRTALVDISNQFDVNIVTLRNCMQMQCMVYCAYGHYTTIERDIQLALLNAENPTQCDYLDELRIYNYEFPNEILPVGFLGEFTDKVYMLYIGSSNIQQIAAGAFGNGVFRSIVLEDLQIIELHRTFFQDISSHFESFTLIQRSSVLHTIHSNFLYHVKYQIKSLTLHAGVDCLRNLTGADNLLNKLSYVDFRYNNFSTQLDVNSFYQLSVVEHIDLSYCEIEFIPDYIFNRMKSSLLYLNVSHNNLLTLSTKIFDWPEMPRNLKIYAGANPWHCDCKLMFNMTEIFVNQLDAVMYCATPPKFEMWQVFDERLCDDDTNNSSGEVTELPPIVETTAATEHTTISTTTVITEATTSTTPGIQSTTSTTTTPINTTSTSPTFGPQTPTTSSPEIGFAPLECVAGTIGGTTFFTNANKDTQYVRWPNLTFFAHANANYAVKITLRLESGNIEESYGLFWFCRTTSEYYKMQLLPELYGIGCYGNVPYETIVENLMPDVAYTFCLVGPDQSEVSPFDCKSVHIGGNMTISYSSWRTKTTRATRISLLVFGIVLFLFGGILAVFLLLKHKPALLKGNKRIMTPNCSTGEIVVLPKHKTVEQMKQKEASLAKTHQRRGIPCMNRRNSLASIASTESYMNTNLYECIPAYLELENVKRPQSSDYFEIYDTGGQKREAAQSPQAATLQVNYTVIGQRTKRASSDPLPELPVDATTRALPILARVSDASAEYTDLVGQV